MLLLHNSNTRYFRDLPRIVFTFFVTMALAAPALAQRVPLGIFNSWGAFRESARCFAIAEPTGARRDDRRPFASVGYWPDRGGMSQFHVRLSREKRAGSAVLLRIDDNSFQLIAGANDAWAPDPRADAAIVAAIRVGLQMMVETRAANGARVRDRYGLRGAATAIDAAAVGCAPRKS